MRELPQASERQLRQAALRARQAQQHLAEVRRVRSITCHVGVRSRWLAAICRAPSEDGQRRALLR